jgi:hypothetical protein
MKVIQYRIDPTYDKAETLRVAGILLKQLLNTAYTLHARGYEFAKDALVFYPLNALEIAKTKKLLISSNTATEGVLAALDENFMKEIEKKQLRIQREEV